MKALQSFTQTLCSGFISLNVTHIPESFFGKFGVIGVTFTKISAMGYLNNRGEQYAFV